MSTKDALVIALTAGWEGALHQVDSLYQVVHLVPDWESKVRDALNDPLRRQSTQARFAPIKRAVEEILQGAEGMGALQRALAEVEKPKD